MKRFTVDKIFKFAFFFLLFLTSLYGMDHHKLYRLSYKHEYRIYSSANCWKISHYSHGKEFVTGAHSNTSAYPKTYFVFSHEHGSWKDYMNDSFTYEDCLLAQAEEFIKTDTLSDYICESNFTLQWQEYNKSTTPKEIPYIEGSVYKLPWTHWQDRGCFRLYMFPTKDEESTYYLFVLATDFPSRHYSEYEKRWNEVFDFVWPHYQ